MKQYAIIDDTQWIYTTGEDLVVIQDFLKDLQKDASFLKYEIVEWETWPDLLVQVIQKIIDAYKADVKLEVSEDNIHLEGRLGESVVSMWICFEEEFLKKNSKAMIVDKGDLWSSQRALTGVHSLCSVSIKKKG